MEASAVRIHHPNREKPQAKATKAGVILLLVVSAALIAVIFVGGFSLLAGAGIVAIAYVVIYLIMAFFTSRWSRGVLPMCAGLAILFLPILAVVAPAWFARDKEGFETPALPPELLGLLTLVLIAVQVLLIIFAMRGFQQEWNVEVEVSDGDSGYEEGYEEDSASGPASDHGGTGGEDEPPQGDPSRGGPQSPR